MTPLVALALLAPACSSGGESAPSSADTGSDYEQAITTVQDAVRPKASQWAASVAEQYLAQLQATGSTEDYLAIVQKMEPETASLNEFLCEQIKDNEALAEEEATNTAPNAEAALSPVIEERA
ncbi:MAG: hypothetical protein ACRD1T_24590 [Acidimicrobiia bacterium]